MNQKPEKKIGRVRSSILSWLGIPIQLTDHSFWSAWNATANKAGQNVSESSVMSLSAAWACTRLISETIATLPLHIYERGPDGVRRKAKNHSLQRILHVQPNSNSTATMYWEAKVAAMLLRGNGFSEKRYINGRLVALDFIPPDRFGMRKNASGNWEALINDRNGKQRTVPLSNLFYISGFSLDGLWGVSAIQYGASVFGSALAANESANSQFEKGLAPTVAYTIDKFLKPDQRTEFRSGLSKITGALQAGESPLLEGGMTASNIGIPPRDAQLLESRGFSVEEVCRWFRVDPSMVGHGNKDSNWGTGLEQKLINFLTFTLRPWLKRIEDAVNTRLLTPSEQLKYHAEFSIEGLLRADSAGRAAFYAAMVNNGIFTRDEVRILENLMPRGGNADVLTVQSAMAPLDSLGEAEDSDSARNALRAWLGVEDPLPKNEERS